jgi:site-specific recombinase XerD
MSDTTFTSASPFAPPPAGELIAVDLDPRRQLAHRAIAGYLAGYSGATLDAYRLDLRQWATWLNGNGVDILSVQRAHIELYARWSEENGLARSTISRRLSTICGLYRYCSQEAVIDRDPAAYVRRPKIDYESHTLGLDRNELGAFLVQAGLCGGRDHALMCLLALNGLRISEALGADIENLEYQRGHRTLFVHRKGHKTATIPLAPRTATSLDLYIGERTSGPIFLNAEGTRRLDRHAAVRIVRRLAKAAGIDKRISPHSLRHSFITAALDAGVPLRDVQEAASHADPRTTMRYDRGRGSLDRHATYIVATFVAGASR